MSADATMRMSHKGACMLVALEGIVPRPYRDQKGLWTYGIGHTCMAGPPNPQTMPRPSAYDQKRDMPNVFKVFDADLQKCEDDVNRAIHVSIKQYEFDALVMFHFNTGAISRAKLTEHVNRREMAAAGRSFMNWCRPRSLRHRRIREQALFVSGFYNHDPITIYWVHADETVAYRAIGFLSAEDVARFMTRKTG
jgi:lysozyme